MLFRLVGNQHKRCPDNVELTLGLIVLKLSDAVIISSDVAILCHNHEETLLYSLSSKLSLFHELASLLASDSNHQTSRDLLNRVCTVAMLKCIAVIYHFFCKIQLLTIIILFGCMLRNTNGGTTIFTNESRFLINETLDSYAHHFCIYCHVIQEGTAKYAELASPRKSKAPGTGMVSWVTTMQFIYFRVAYNFC